MNSRARTSSPRRALRRESSYESARLLNTPPPLPGGLPDIDDLSPRSLYSRPALSPYFDRSDEYRHLRSFTDRLSDSDSLPRMERERRLHQVRQDAMTEFLPGAAMFLGEKIMIATEHIDDVLALAVVYYQQQEYSRALELLNTKKTISKSVPCRYLAAMCSLGLGNARDALDYLGHKNPFSGKDMSQEDQHYSIRLDSCLCYARGKAYKILEENDKARDCFKEALTIDVKCYDALEALVKYNMMDEQTEWQFVMTLPFEAHCGADAEYYRYLYGLKLKKDILNGQRLDSDMENISKSLDVKLSKAERYFTECRYEECLDICKDMKVQDPFFKESIPLHLACLYELGKKTELFEYAQDLVNRLNSEAVTWHAVGLYYLYVKKNLEARRYFEQALALDQHFEQSWLCFGHSFSAEKDHQQAIDAYKNCSRMIPGSHLPPMNIAMQYMEQNQLDKAYEYFALSKSKSHNDPFLYNEIAVYYYKIGDYKEAKRNFHEALDKAKKFQYSKRVFWEKLWCNLGHVYRQTILRDDERALRCFENTLLKNPDNWDARASVGMIYQLKGNTARAIVEYQKVLMNVQTSGLVNELLEKALKENAQEPLCFDHLLNDSFDIFQMDNFTQEMKDPVDIELDESYWIKVDPSEEDMIEEVEASTEDLIIDKGDLSRRDMSKWL